jgi:hypothetical protein
MTNRACQALAVELPDHPVGALCISSSIKDLRWLAEEPLRADLAAVQVEPRFARFGSTDAKKQRGEEGG